VAFANLGIAAAALQDFTRSKVIWRENIARGQPRRSILPANADPITQVRIGQGVYGPIHPAPPVEGAHLLFTSRNRRMIDCGWLLPHIDPRETESRPSMLVCSWKDHQFGHGGRSALPLDR
jgi:hypothetical protein